MPETAYVFVEACQRCDRVLCRNSRIKAGTSLHRYSTAPIFGLCSKLPTNRMPLRWSKGTLDGSRSSPSGAVCTKPGSPVRSLMRLVSLSESKGPHPRPRRRDHLPCDRRAYRRGNRPVSHSHSGMPCALALKMRSPIDDDACRRRSRADDLQVAVSVAPERQKDQIEITGGKQIAEFGCRGRMPRCHQRSGPGRLLRSVIQWMHKKSRPSPIRRGSA